MVGPACPRCGRENLPGRKVCLFCGVSLAARVAPDAAVDRLEFAPRASVRRSEEARRAVVIAAALPGGGHFFLRLWLRGAIFFCAVAAMLVFLTHDLVLLLLDYTDQLANLEAAEAVGRRAGGGFRRVFALGLGAMLVHLVSILDAYRAGRKS